MRLALSAVLLLMVLAVIRLLWYPGAHFAISGVSSQLWILAAIVIVIGPILSTLVFRPGKKGLRMDLWILGGIEVAAIVIAMAVLFQRQPYFMVFAVDRFEAVPRHEVVDFELAKQRFGGRPGHEPRLVHAALPEDSKRMQDLIDETVFMGMPDIDRRPEFWSAYPTGVVLVKMAARPLEELVGKRQGRAGALTGWLERSGRPVQAFRFLPLRGKNSDAVVIIDALIGYPVATFAIDPWVSSSQDGEPPRDVEQTHQ